MAKTQDIKRRIRSVRNTMQLTRAMKMVAAAKLRRAQERMQGARPYAQRTLKVLRSLASRASADEHPLLEHRGGDRFEIVVVTADRGLCGAFNSGIIRTADAFLDGQVDRELTINSIGKKGRDHFSRRRNLVREWPDVFRLVEYSTAQKIAEDLMTRYTDGEVDKIFMVFNEFKSAIQATPTVRQLLPIEPEKFEAGETPEEYIYEPSAAGIFAALLPHYVENQIFQAMLESSAAEHAARMTAMDAATSNAGELIESLTLTMNRVRQAAITTEIIEVVSGAEAQG
jgi:F-type H+-transporting ATPase subunit gamma